MFFLKKALEKPPRRQWLSSFTQHESEVLGCFKPMVLYKDKSVIGTLYVVTKCTNVLDRDLIKALQIDITVSTLSCYNVQKT